MTVNEVLKHVIPALESIKVPIPELDSIGLPIAAAVNDLKKCVDFMESVEREIREKAENEAALAAETHSEAEAQNVEEGVEKIENFVPKDDPEDLFGEEPEPEGGEEE